MDREESDCQLQMNVRESRSRRELAAKSPGRCRLCNRTVMLLQGSIYRLLNAVKSQKDTEHTNHHGSEGMVLHEAWIEFSDGWCNAAQLGMVDPGKNVMSWLQIEVEPKHVEQRMIELVPTPRCA